MNVERMRKELDAEIASQEAKCDAPVPVTEGMLEDIESIVRARLVDKIKLHDMKVDHALLFGTHSPYFGLL